MKATNGIAALQAQITALKFAKREAETRASDYEMTAKALRAQLAAQAGHENIYPACKGKNCGSMDGNIHSTECLAEHDACVSVGSNLLDTAGNRNPEYRYAGYRGDPCGKSAPEDQRRAWKEGRDAASRLSAPPAPTNSLAIVQAALEAAAKYHDDCEKVSIFRSGRPAQTIIADASKGPL